MSLQDSSGLVIVTSIVLSDVCTTRSGNCIWLLWLIFNQQIPYNLGRLVVEIGNKWWRQSFMNGRIVEFIETFEKSADCVDFFVFNVAK